MHQINYFENRPVVGEVVTRTWWLLIGPVSVAFDWVRLEIFTKLQNLHFLPRLPHKYRPKSIGTAKGALEWKAVILSSDHLE